MTEEIKEILNYIDDRIIPNEKWDKIKDYITNLQQAIEIKNQRIKEEQQEKERYIKSYNGLNTWNKELQQENEKLKYNARGQVNDYFKDKYADEVLKNADLIKDFELTCYKNYELKQENEKLKEEIDILKSNFEVEIDDCENYKKWYRDYKSRCEKANTYINEEIKKIQEHQYSTGVRRLKKIQNILNRSDEK